MSAFLLNFLSKCVTQVNLGEGVTCSIVGYSTIVSTTDLNSWCTALLQGVFGQKAKLYRYRVQKQNVGKLKPFPPGFRNVAKGKVIHYLFASDYVVINE